MNHIFLNMLMALFAAQIVHTHLTSFSRATVYRKPPYFAVWMLYLFLQYYLMAAQSIYNPLLPIFANILLITLIHFFYGIPLKNALFHSCILGTSWMAVEAITRGFLLAAGTDEAHFFITGNLISKFAMYIIIQTYKWLWGRNRIVPLPFLHWFELALVPFSSILTICSAYLLTLGKRTNLLFGLISFLTILVNYIIFDIQEKMALHALIERQNLAYEHEISLCVRQAAEREEAYRQTRILRHDLKGRLLALSALLEEQRTEDAIKEIRKMLKENSLNRHYISESGNTVLDALINYTYSASIAEGIRMDCCLETPAELFVEGADLCVILANLLDNALEAVRNLPEDKDKWISLTVRLIKGVLIIHVENPYVGEITMDCHGKLRSSKSGDHGIGLQSVERTASKYKGELIIRHENEVFHTSVNLYQRKILHDKP